MPVKRRVAKRRLDPRAEARAWGCLFDCGHDFFGDLAELGIPLDPYGCADPATVREAWNRLGNLYLATRRPDREAWALKTYGGPKCL